MMMSIRSENEVFHPENKPQAILSFNDVRMVFIRGLKHPVQALRGLSLSLEKGSIVGLLGPNGCGKTTAVSCLTGLLFPQSGDIRIFGAPVAKVVNQDREKSVGVVLEDTRLPPYLKVETALQAVCRIRDIPATDIKNEFERICETAGVTDLLTLRINSLSRGQARRVGVAAALAGDPPILVMDEPASGLDISARVKFNELVRRLCDGKRTVLITSHLLSDVENTCTHIAIMEKGRVKVFDETRRVIGAAEDNEVDIFIHEKHREALDALGLAYTTCRYPQLLKLDFGNVPAYEILGLLAARKISPRRVEPRKNLIKYYLDVTENEA